jgi:hypothetical protein
MTATRFGDCVCGQPKAAHSEAATVGGGPAPVGLSTHDKPTDLRREPFRARLDSTLT